MNRTESFARPGSDSLHQRHELRSNLVDRTRVGNQQFRRGRCAFRERNYVQDKMLDWEYLKDTLVLASNWQIAESHQCRISQVSEHGLGVHLAPTWRRGARYGTNPLTDRRPVRVF